MGQDIFFEWAAPTNGYFTFSTCADLDLVMITIYDGGDCSATCIESSTVSMCYFDGGTEVSTGLLSAGHQILVRIGDPAGGGGFGISANLFISASSAPPVNNTCATPTVISGEGTFPFDRSFATSSGFEGGAGLPCVDDLQHDVFLAWTATASGTYEFATCADANLTSLSLHSGNDCSATCLDSFHLGTCFDAEHGYSRLPNVTTGDTYLIQAGRWSAGYTFHSGLGWIDITRFPSPAPNDDCNTPLPINGVGTFNLDRTFASTSGFDGGSPACRLAFDWHMGSSGGPPVYDTFFVWAAPSNGVFRFFASEVNVDTVMSIHSGSDCSATCLASSEDSPSFFFSAEIEVTGGMAGSEFLIQLGQGAPFYTPGVVSLDVTLITPPPSNDTCAFPAAMPPMGTIQWSNELAMTSGFTGGAPCPSSPALQVQNDLFYAWTAPSSGDFIVDTVGSDGLTHLQVHAGTDCSATCVDFDFNNDPQSSSQILLTSVTAGDPYVFQVGTQVAGPDVVTLGQLSVGTYSLPPVHNDCLSATVITGEVSLSVSTLSATTSSFNGSSTSCGLVYNDVFYQWTPECSGTYLVVGCTQSSFVPRLNVHAGTGCSATCLGASSLVSSTCANAPPMSMSSELVFAAVAGTPYLIQVGGEDFLSSGDGLLVVERLEGVCTDGILTLVCDPASPHYLGSSVTLAASSFALDVLHVEATGGPPDEFGFFIVAATANANVAAFNGVLCLDGSIGRYSGLVANNQGLPQLNSLGRFNAAGVLENLAGTSTTGLGFDLPRELPFAPAGQVIQPGDTWCIQLWYRDQIAPLPNPGSTANFSNVLVGTFP